MSNPNPIQPPSPPATWKLAVFWPAVIGTHPWSVFWSASAAFLISGIFPWQVRDITDFLRGYGAGAAAMYAQLEVLNAGQDIEMAWARVPDFIKKYV